MTGFWKTVFTANGRQMLQEKVEYEASLQRRISILNEFRSSAIQEIKTLHPDAVFLMSSSSAKFLAVSKTSRVLIEGEFEDRHVPALEYVDTNDADANLQMASATSDFGKRVTKYLSDRKRIGFFLPFDSPTEKGYSYRIKSLNLAYAVKVAKNGKDVAKATFRSSKERIELTQKIYKEIVEQLSAGIVVTLRIEVAVFDEYMQSDSLCYEFSYYDEVRRTLAQNKDFLLGVCNNIIPFLTVMVAVLEQPPALNELEEWDDNADELALLSAEAWMNPPSPPERSYDWDADGNFIGDPNKYEYMPEGYQPKDYEKAPPGWKKTTE